MNRNFGWAVSGIAVVVFVAAGIYLRPFEPAAISTYQFPSPGSRLASPAVSIALRFAVRLNADLLSAGLMTVTGDRSGEARGTLQLADDARTIIFAPENPFQPGEQVSINFAGGWLGEKGEKISTVVYAFSVSPRQFPYATLGSAGTPAVLPPVGPVNGYRTAPQSVPVFTVTNNLGTAPSNEFIFLNQTAQTPNPYLLILDATGDLVYYRSMDPRKTYADFKPLTEDTLSFFEGDADQYGGQGAHVLLDASYNRRDPVPPAFGLHASPHELLVLPDGHSLEILYDQQPVLGVFDGAPANGQFLDLIVQERDSRDLVVFQWRASEHMDFEESWEPITGTLSDPFHGNSVEALPDGNLLVSLRHTSSLVKINRETGALMWRMGGKQSDFTFVDDAGFFYQHDARWLPGNHLTVFDNGNLHKPPRSRAVEYRVDERARTVSRVWEYRHTPDIYNFFMGNAQRLANGNTFIGWGGPRAIASEVTPSGQLVFEIEIRPPAGLVYRWYKARWMGRPDTTPDLVFDTDDGTPTLYFSWNGATDIARYRLEGGATPAQIAPIALVERAGFETSHALAPAHAGLCFFRVVPQDAAGRDLRQSDVIKSDSAACK